METSISGSVQDEEKAEENNDVDVHSTYFCLICYNNIEGDRPYYTLPCQHTYCHSCLQAYLESNIMSGQVTMKCFHVDNFEPNDIGKPAHACNALIPEYTILDILQGNPEYVTKFTRFKFLKSSSNARECPYCSYFEIGDPLHPAIVCANCQKSYCFSHALAHPSDISCSDYEKNISSQSEVNIICHCPSYRFLTILTD
jgi:hypothetical protein